MDKNPYSDGRIRSHLDAIIRAVLLAGTVLISWNAPTAWYWRIVIFVGLMFVLGILYPTIQMAWAKRKERRYRLLLQKINPAAAQYENETQEFVAKMNKLSKSHLSKTIKDSLDGV